MSDYDVDVDGEVERDPEELIDCGNCGGVFHVDEDACPGCGWSAPDPEDKPDHMALDGPEDEPLEHDGVL